MGCNCRSAQQRAAADAARRAAAQDAQARLVARPSSDPTVNAAPPPPTEPRVIPNPYGTTQSFALITEQGRKLEAEAARVRAERRR